jgi:hypothetical protein
MVRKVVCRVWSPWFILLALQAFSWLFVVAAHPKRWASPYECRKRGVVSVAATVGLLGCAERRCLRWNCEQEVAKLDAVHGLRKHSDYILADVGRGGTPTFVDPAHAIGFPDQVPQQSGHGPPPEGSIQSWRVDLSPSSHHTSSDNGNSIKVSLVSLEVTDRTSTWCLT